MKKLVAAAIAAAAFSTTGCAAGISYMQRPVIGAYSVYAQTSAPEFFTDDSRTNGKAGEACSTSILGIITTGNASATEAARKAGITRIRYTENTFENILGLYAKYCLVVHGD